MHESIGVPIEWIGPLRLVGPEVQTEIKVPLATFETTMWPSTNRGASVTRHCAGLQAVIVDERMTRSVLVEAENAVTAKRVIDDLHQRELELAQAFQGTSRFARLIDWNYQIVGNLIYLRLEGLTGDASGHNMLTKAADAVLHWLLGQYPELKYVSVSGNFCTDKKVSAVNGLLGRGKYVIVDMIIPKSICLERLKTTPQKIVDLHIKKNLLGSIVAGGLRTANAHFANLLYAFYLATGQDVANIVEGSQGFVHCELRGEDLYFSVTLPNIIVGTIGNGKHLAFVQENLRRLGCLETQTSGLNARRLAIIVAATVWCGEISLLAAQTNPGELMRAHERFERKEVIEA